MVVKKPGHKNKKRKPGEFQKARRKHLYIQHNREQLKLLKECKIEVGELFILHFSMRSEKRTAATLKKVTIRLSSEYEPYGGQHVVYYSHGNGQQSKLSIGHFAERYNVILDNNNGAKASLNDLIGIVVKEEILKEYSYKRNN